MFIKIGKHIVDIGAPKHIRNDNAKAVTSILWMKIILKYNISGSKTEPYNLQQNPSERMIQELKKYTINCHGRYWNR